MNETTHLYLTAANGVAVLSVAMQLGGLWLCLFHRRLSPRMIVMAAGFAGLFVAGLINRFSAYVLTGDTERMFLAYLVGAVLSFASMIVLIFGLAAVLADVRRQLSYAKGRDDDFS